MEYTFNVILRLLIACSKQLDTSLPYLEQTECLMQLHRLEMEKANMFQVYLAILLLVLCVAGLGFFFFRRKLERKECDVQNIKALVYSYSVKLKENEATIRSSEELIRLLSDQLNETTDGRSKLSHGIEQLCLIESNAYLQARESFLLKQLVEHMETLNVLKSSSHYLSEEQWVAVVRDINTICNNFVDRLQADFPLLTTDDLHFCCLIRLHIPVSAIAVLIAISPTSVSRRKLRIKEKINQSIAPSSHSVHSLETFLRSRL